MDSVEAELEGRVARLFARRPELFEIGVSPRRGREHYDEVYDDIARAITAAVAAQPAARRLLPGRTFVRALH